MLLDFMSNLHILFIIFFLILGLVVLVKSADFFVDAAVKIAEISGIPKIIIGATIVSLATTLPELFTSISALSASSEMAVGNALGSVLFNTSVILSIAAIFMSGNADRKNITEKAIILGVALFSLWVFASDGVVKWYEGLVQLSFVVIYTVVNIISTKNQKKTTERVHVDNKSAVLIAKFIILVVSAFGIFVGSKFMVTSSQVIAMRASIPDRVISITVLAIGTSLPELSTTITSVIKKEQSLSVGNVLGANILNITLVLGTCGTFVKNGLSIESSTLTIDLPFAFGVIALFVVPIMINGKLKRWQGVVGLLAYLGYMTYLLSTI